MHNIDETSRVDYNFAVFNQLTFNDFSFSLPGCLSTNNNKNDFMN